ncbi:MULTISPECIES: CGNR zinc finger domain-containing protein [Streptomyces]|uniref:CGNR zinc finger domain-containing protein n=1 Tax=Streptomyces flaveolus TaxID=67297 RepID=A0ABV3ALN5_9ACTN|nr:CGNR zinc finger domain-containing protein [Streptomyces sp. NRRL WC-3725]
MSRDHRGQHGHTASRARERCGLALVDTSRNGRRRYRTVRYAHNDAVARHRRRATGA